MDSEEWIKDIRSGCVNKTKDVIFSSKYVSELADFIEQQAKQIESMKEILGDVLSDCYLSDGMRSEIEKRMEWDGGNNGS